jgi:hypothetical protein
VNSQILNYFSLLKLVHLDESLECNQGLKRFSNGVAFSSVCT